MEIDLRRGVQELDAKPHDEDGGAEEAQVWGQITHNVPSINRAEPEKIICVCIYLALFRVFQIELLIACQSI